MEIITARAAKITHLHKSGSCIAATDKLYGEAADFWYILHDRMAD